MEVIIVDDNAAYTEQLTEQEWSGNPVQYSLTVVEEIGDLSPRQIAEQVAREVGDYNAVVFINANLKCEGRSRQEQAGVEVLKFLRLTERFGLRENRAQDVHCVMYSFRSVEQILRDEPSSLIICSDGVTFKRLPEDLSGLDIQELAAEKAPVDELDKFVRGEFRLPDERHSWANWWAARQMIKLYRLEKGSEVPYESQDNSDIPKLSKTKTIYNRDDSKVSISEIRDDINSPEIRNALYLFDKSSALHDLFSENDRSQMEKCRDVLRNSDSKIGLIDDESQKISRGPGQSIGWQSVYSHIFYDNEQQVVDLLGDKYLDVHLDPSDEEALESLLNRLDDGMCDLDSFACILLDLRLIEDSTKPGEVADTSGVQVLSKIRELEPTLPVIATTASNKVSSFLEITETGADAYWVKQGIDERRTAEELLENYTRLFKTVSSTLGEKYQFFRRFGKATKSLKEKNDLWWEEKEWYDKEYEKKVITRGRKEVVFGFLNGCIILMRSYLRKHEIRDVKNGKQENGKDFNIVTLYSIVQHMGKILEEVHRWDKIKDESDRNSGIIGGYYNKNKNKYVVRRADWMGFKLYQKRNDASHLPDSEKDEINWDIARSFISYMMCYLKIGPKESFEKIREEKRSVPSVITMKYKDDEYEHMFSNIYHGN